VIIDADTSLTIASRGGLTERWSTDEMVCNEGWGEGRCLSARGNGRETGIQALVAAPITLFVAPGGD
jgi:hypothetical protein